MGFFCGRVEAGRCCASFFLNCIPKQRWKIRMHCLYLLVCFKTETCQPCSKTGNKRHVCVWGGVVCMPSCARNTFLALQCKQTPLLAQLSLLTWLFCNQRWIKCRARETLAICERIVCLFIFLLKASKGRRN